MKKRFVPTLFLIAYSALLVKLMVFKSMPTIKIGQLMLNFGGTESGHPANFIPFKTIYPYLLGDKGWIIAGINLFGNILLLVPIGFLMTWIFRNVTWKKSVIVAILTGLAIESSQVILNVGIFDIDDVILNALGVMIGYWTFRVLDKWWREKGYKSIVLSLVIVLTAAGAAFYSIYPWGQPVVSPEARTGGMQSNFEEEKTTPQNGDLCGGTGGTGEIMEKGENMIMIKRNDGTSQAITLTDQTMIKNSTGMISVSDLKIEDRVTVVIDETETASVVLVCNVAKAE